MSENPGDSSIVTRRDLFKTGRSHNEILLVYPAAEADSYLPVLEDLRSQAPAGRFELRLQADTATTPGDLCRLPSLLLGAIRSNRLIPGILKRTPFQQEGSGFHIDQGDYSAPSTIFKLSYYPNPDNRRMPVHLLTGLNDDKIIAFIRDKYGPDGRQLFWSRWGYELYEDNRLIMLGNLSDSTWQMDKAVHYQFTDRPDTLHQTRSFIFLGNRGVLDADTLLSLGQACQAIFDSVIAFTGKESEGLQITCQLYGSMEEKGLRCQNTDPAHLDFDDREVHVLVDEDFRGECRQEENRLLLRTLLGESQSPALEHGLALFFTKKWGDQGYNFWTGRLYQSGNLPPLTELLDRELFERESELVMKPMAATFTGFLLEYWGKHTFLQRYREWKPDGAAVGQLQAPWEAYLKKKFADQVRTPRTNVALPYQKGFNFAHEGYQIYNGYGSALAAKSLEKLDKIGSNAIAIVPYSGQRSVSKPDFIPISRNPGSETDESVIFSKAKATRLGMVTMLKPQIWYGRSWPGEVQMETEADWALFFDYYYRWIRHYSLLAEMQNFDILCLGVEFVKTTTQQPEQWRKIVARIRGLYSGKLTYAANWGEEFEQFSFWKDFDYIGLNCYYPLSEGSSPSDAALKKRFAEVLEKAEEISKKNDRPLLFTEIGFRSVEAPWKNPHAEAQDRPVNELHQDRCYRIVLEGIRGKDWIQGLYWWKWPSYLDHNHARDDGFTPNRKLAEKTVMEQFTTDK